ncbi:EmrKY-TolC system oxoacyl-(acyl carrier protein) reductase [Escherichia coli]|nr:EmrKY-TolC system oxoacyl-(acyl carrier protein) reductase [Escherichia coli]
MHYQPKQDLLNDRIILVTGASDGIGREAAMTYARYGATVILLGRNEEKLRQVASHINEEIGRQPQWFILDLLTARPKIANNWHSALPLIIRVWMVFCIMPDCSAMFAQ